MPPKKRTPRMIMEYGFAIVDRTIKRFVPMTYNHDESKCWTNFSDFVHNRAKPQKELRRLYDIVPVTNYIEPT